MMSGNRYFIDASMIRGGGGFTHLVNVMPELARMAPEDTFRVVCGDERVLSALPKLPNLEVEYLGEMRLRDRVRFTYSEASRRAAEWGADLYFSASEMTPLVAPCPMVAAFQNPNVFDLGANYKLPWKQHLRLRILNTIARISARLCERVVFVSEDSANWMGEAAGLPEEKRTPIVHGIDTDLWRKPAAATNASHQRPYILSVSSIYPYKNYVRLIEAYALMAKTRSDIPDLVIVGDNQDDDYLARMEEAREATGELAEQIHIIGEVPYSEIQSWYHGAELFVFPSHLETFGIPMIEAMAADLPIVAADIPVFREIAEDAAFYVDPFEPASIASGMDAALFQADAAETLVKRGRERLKEFTWDRTALKLLNVFRSVLAEAKESKVDLGHSRRVLAATSFHSYRH
jgi:glycosyltransferase involved in cell wall biosynthesis